MSDKELSGQAESFALDDAVNALARGTRAGNLSCMRELGKRLYRAHRAGQSH